MPLRAVMTGGRDGASTSGTDCSLTLPASAVAGDFGVVITSANLGSPTVATPTGWTVRVDGDVASANNKAYIYTKVLTADDITAGTVSLVWSSTGRTIASGVVLYDVADFESITTTDPLTTDLPSITTVADNCDVVFLAASRTADGGAAVSTYPSGITKQTDAKTTFASGVNTANSIAMLDTPGPAGTYGGGTITYSVAPTSALTYAVAITPATEPPPDNRPDRPRSLQWNMQRLSGTTLDVQGAANEWAGTEGLALLGALNHKNGTRGVGLQGVLNELAGTEGLGVAAAASKIKE